MELIGLEVEHFRMFFQHSVAVEKIAAQYGLPEKTVAQYWRAWRQQRKAA